jgi:hypothetical protein
VVLCEDKVAIERFAERNGSMTTPDFSTIANRVAQY